jgi:Delta7-sterol 5-desaturase
MDVVVELVDTFAGDYIYANLYPAKPAPHDLYLGNDNATEQVFSSWQYTPATKYFQVPPTQYAYMSAWNRDNIYRQAITLFTITWLVPLMPPASVMSIAINSPAL